MDILAKTISGKFVIVCHGKFRDLSGVAMTKCKKSFQKGKRHFFKLADQVHVIRVLI